MPFTSEYTEKELINEDSIVALPFRNLSSDAENEFFSDGITEEIINALTKVEGLNVIARTSSFAFKGKDIDLRELGSQLKVNYVLEGSVRRSGNKVRVTAQLIKASDGFHIFSEAYDREIRDIFEVQDELASKIAQKFTDKVGIQKNEEVLIPPSTKNIEAYELFLKGRFHLNKGSLEATKAAIQYFEASQKKDKKFVLPLTGLAACYTFLGGSGLMNVNEAFKIAKEYSSNAILIDESIAETHLALAKSYFWCDWDFKNTGIEIGKAIQLSPGTASIHGFYSEYLMACGRFDEAMIEARLAAKLDPLSLKGKFRLGELYFRSEKFIDATEIFNEILGENPFFQQASILKAWCHLFAGDPELSADIFSNIPVTTERSITFFGGMAYAYSRVKQIDKVLECMQNFKTEVSKGYQHWLNYNYTLLFRALGEKEKMFTFLEKSLIEKHTPLIFINADPVWEEFRSDKKFKSLIDTCFIPEKQNRIIRIKSDTKEELEINLKNLVFIEAQENYSNIVWIDNDNLHEKLLRVTLKHIENQIHDSHIIRCHRSFIINTNFKFTIQGNSNGYKLHSKYFKNSIPISRSLGKEVVGKLRES